jgi:hypothetical protein
MRAHSNDVTSSDRPDLCSLAKHSPNIEMSTRAFRNRETTAEWHYTVGPTVTRQKHQTKQNKEFLTHFKILDCGLLRIDSVQSHRQIMEYRRNMLLSSSGSVCILDCTVPKLRRPQFEQSTAMKTSKLTSDYCLCFHRYIQRVRK